MLAKPGPCLARRLDDAPPPARWALPGEHLSRAVRQAHPRRADVFAFGLALDPDVPPPAVGDALAPTLSDGSFGRSAFALRERRNGHAGAVDGSLFRACTIPVRNSPGALTGVLRAPVGGVLCHAALVARQRSVQARLGVGGEVLALQPGERVTLTSAGRLDRTA